MTVSTWNGLTKDKLEQFGATGPTCEPFLGKLSLWFTTGEPVWMAAESLAFLAKQRVIIDRAERNSMGLRRPLAGAR